MLEEITNAIIGGSDNHGYHHIIYTDVSLKDVTSDIIKMNTNDNLIVYIDDFGLLENPYIDERISKSLCNDYLNLVIFEKTIEKVIKDEEEVDVSMLESILTNNHKVSDANELLKLIKKSKYFIENMYYKKRQCWEEYEKLPINIMSFDMENLPKACNRKRLTVVFDNQNEMCDDSKLMVNDIIGSRCTKYLTCILSTRREKWIGLMTSNHQLIEEPHDYLEINDGEKVYKKERYYE